jgi:hypothetical protein
LDGFWFSEPPTGHELGHLDLTYEGMTLAADPDLVMFAFTAEVGSKSEESLNLLASWTATPDQESPDSENAEQRRHRRRA